MPPTGQIMLQAWTTLEPAYCVCIQKLGHGPDLYMDTMDGWMMEQSE